MYGARKAEQNINNCVHHKWGHLNLRNCGLREIPEILLTQNHIVTIDLGNDALADEVDKNHITSIPKGINKLTLLRKLKLDYNQITDLPEELSDLKNLKLLDLRGNLLSELPERIANMEGLTDLLISDNPFDLLPPEIAEKGIDSVRNFFKELKEQDYLFEAKLIIVGEGRVGKTCLANALIESSYKLRGEDSTEGININSWVIPADEIRQINRKITRDLQINIWDFGGQEIYHSTHQFFLTKRAIYLLVTESRKEDRHDDFYYWLNVIKLLGDNSPVAMVLNKCDQPTKDLPIKEYKSTFPNIISFNKVSLLDEFRDEFNSFKHELILRASQLQHIGHPLPKVWVDIRRDIEGLKLSGKDYISTDEYYAICRAHYRKEDSALFLSSYFHDLGVILHFQDDPDLRDIVILNHEWITKGVYKVLDDRIVIGKKGRFNFDDLLRIWSTEDHKGRVRELLCLMKNHKFDLCFEISPNEFLVPRLLPVDEVEFDWDSDKDNLKYEIRYKFMPKGILTRLIVKLNSDIYNEKFWRYGVFLFDEESNTYAIIRERYFENKISIEIKGENKREYLYHIKKALRIIHKDYNNLEISEMIPCICSKCIESLDPFFFSNEVLKRYGASSIQKIRCDQSLEEVDVSQLTNSVISVFKDSNSIFLCEGENASILSLLDWDGFKFIPEKNSGSIFSRLRTGDDFFGIRDRDFLLDTEIANLSIRFPRFGVIRYYCFENFIYHPDNLSELLGDNFDKESYIQEITEQKNRAKGRIISNFKSARKGYTEFRYDPDQIQDKKNEESIISDLESNDFETFYKFFSMKDHFDKAFLEKYQIRAQDAIATSWFKNAFRTFCEELINRV